MWVGKGNGKRPNSNQNEISYSFAHDVYIGKSFEPLRRCPYIRALEEAEEDDFEKLVPLEIGPLNIEAAARGSNGDDVFGNSSTFAVEVVQNIFSDTEAPTRFGDSSGIDLGNSELSYSFGDSPSNFDFSGSAARVGFVERP